MGVRVFWLGLGSVRVWGCGEIVWRCRGWEWWEGRSYGG